MTHKGIPLSNYECSTSLLCRGSTPIQALSYASYPVSYYFAAFLFASLQELFCNRPCNMPDVKKMVRIHTWFTDPLCYASVAVWNKHSNCKPKTLQKGKTSDTLLIQFAGCLQSHWPGERQSKKQIVMRMQLETKPARVKHLYKLSFTLREKDLECESKVGKASAPVDKVNVQKILPICWCLPITAD